MTTTKGPKEVALKLASNALNWVDDAIEKVRALESSAEPLACRLGCHFCCFNQPMVTPPEALLIGHFTGQHLSDQEMQDLLDRIGRVLELTNGKSFEEIVKMRHEMPCIFLKEGMCLVYEARPAICRTCSSTDAEHCKTVLESGDPFARLRCPPHMRTVFQNVHTGLLNQCEKMECQAEPLLIAEALRDYLGHPRPSEAWVDGEKVFSSSLQSVS